MFILGVVLLSTIAGALLGRPSTPTHTPPDQPHLDLKLQILEWLNEERAKAGSSPLKLGGNAAVQIHAENSLASCTWFLWSEDGLKAYHRYSLAGGYQVSFPEGFYISHSPDHCQEPANAYVTLSEPLFPKITPWLEQRVHGHPNGGTWLDPYFETVSIGLAWDTYTLRAFIELEPDYTEFEELPTIRDGVLSVHGRTKRGISFQDPEGIAIALVYDPPPGPLTEWQLLLAECYSHGRPVAFIVRESPSGIARFPTDRTTWTPCKNPYDLEPDEQVDKSPPLATVTVLQITASEWDVAGDWFAVTADISDVLAKHGEGIYTLWLATEDVNDFPVGLARYSIFHGIPRPTTYSRPAAAPPHP